MKYEVSETAQSAVHTKKIHIERTLQLYCGHISESTFH